MAAIVAAFLLVEVYLHELRGLSLASGFAFAALSLAAAGLAFRNYGRLGGLRWAILGAVLALLGISLMVEAAAIEPLPWLTLPRAFPEPRRGLTAVTHLVSDVSVLGLGVLLLLRWYSMRRSGVRSRGTAVVAVASFTACCGTTAVLLTAILSAVFGSAAIHSGFSWVLAATVLTASLLALAFALTGGVRFAALRSLFSPRGNAPPRDG